MAAERRTLSYHEKLELGCSQSWRCAGCDALLPPTFQIDHIQPLATWPSGMAREANGYDNLQALCPNCHARKTQREARRLAKFVLCSKRCGEREWICWHCGAVYSTYFTHECEWKAAK